MKGRDNPGGVSDRAGDGPSHRGAERGDRNGEPNRNDRTGRINGATDDADELIGTAHGEIKLPPPRYQFLPGGVAPVSFLTRSSLVPHSFLTRSSLVPHSFLIPAPVLFFVSSPCLLACSARCSHHLIRCSHRLIRFPVIVSSRLLVPRPAGASRLPSRSLSACLSSVPLPPASSSRRVVSWRLVPASRSFVSFLRLVMGVLFVFVLFSFACHNRPAVFFHRSPCLLPIPIPSSLMICVARNESRGEPMR